jgi:DNA invertase Pin-like site-specific DNA recombinase
MRIGYARVSTDEQDTAAQVSALEAYGCTTIYRENKSGGKAGRRWDRPDLHKALDSLGPDDTFVVWKLDRLSRSLSDLLHLLAQIKNAGASFESLTEHIETKSAAGVLMMNMLACFAQFERQMIKERTKLGIARARAEGRWGNAKFALTPIQQKEALQMVAEGRSQAEVAKLFGIQRSTLWRLLSERRVLERAA